MKKALILFVIIFLMTMLVPLISMTKSSSSSELVTLFNGEGSICISSFIPDDSSRQSFLHLT